MRQGEKGRICTSLIRNSVQACILDNLTAHTHYHLHSFNNDFFESVIAKGNPESCSAVVKPMCGKTDRSRMSNLNDTHHSTKHNRLLNLTRSLSNTSPITLQIPKMVTDKAADAANGNNAGPWQYISLLV